MSEAEGIARIIAEVIPNIGFIAVLWMMAKRDNLGLVIGSKKQPVQFPPVVFVASGGLIYFASQFLR